MCALRMKTAVSNYKVLRYGLRYLPIFHLKFIIIRIPSRYFALKVSLYPLYLVHGFTSLPESKVICDHKVPNYRSIYCYNAHFPSISILVYRLIK